MLSSLLLLLSRARLAVGPGEGERLPLGGSPSRQQVVEERGGAGAHERVEGGDGEHAQAVQGLLRRLRHLGQDALQKKEESD